MVVDIKIDTRNVTNMLEGYKRTIPIGARRGTWLVALKMQKALKDEIKNQNLIWRGNLLNETRARKISKNTFGIFMPIHGKYLDSMRTHWVSLKRGRLITQWAKDKGIQAGAIKVKKHPFIDKPFLKVSKKAKSIVLKEINKAIRRKGKR